METNTENTVTAVILPVVLQYVDKDMKEISIRTSDFEDKNLVWYLSWHLNQRLENLIEFPRYNKGNYDYRSGDREYLVDKADALKQLGDMYGKPISDESLLEKNHFFILEGDKIGVSGAKCKHYRHWIEDEKGKMTAIFNVNADSFFGYSLESITLN